jgi:phenylalanyl-tRNA synthetase beta chain
MALEVPYHKPDVSLPADIVEEIVRIDGLDSIEIPSAITITPSIEENYRPELLKEKLSNVLAGLGFTEILTNSITNSAFFSDEELRSIVKLVNNLSSELDIMRPSMLHTAMSVVSFNLNHKNQDLKLFEFGKTYSAEGVGKYREENHLSLYLTGSLSQNHWKEKSRPADAYYLKGLAEALLSNLGIRPESFEKSTSKELESGMIAFINGSRILELGKVDNSILSKFDIRQPVYFADLYWDELMKYTGNRIQYREVSKFPAVERDLAMVVPKSMKYVEIEEKINKLKLNKLQNIRLFDVFESEKLGTDKKSLAINLTFQDEEKTLTDKEIDSWMNKIMITLEKDLNAEIRKQ